ncbi:hypothetical protein HK105_205154 [Polyrhizophydium stewartii]|uniref:Xylanolytic transcriptional activator regulatory domain-containing protein n=1 Tax=Polyrhizophydium stewartii TaxID=2732419 RepID=A0ABR4N748_9FUNG
MDSSAAPSTPAPAGHRLRIQPAVADADDDITPPLLSHMSLQPSGKTRTHQALTPVHKLRPDLFLLFEAMVAPHLFLFPFSYVRERLDESPLVQNSVASLMLSLSVDQSRPFHEAALADVGKVLVAPTPIGVIGMFVLSLSVVQHSENKDISAMHSYTIRAARTLGINTREGIAALSANEVEREIFRRIWWSIVSLDLGISTVCNIPWQFDDADCQVPLPRDDDAPQAHPFDLDEELAIAVMASTGWSVPSLPNLGVTANLMVVEKILRRAFRFNRESRSGVLKGSERLCTRAAIDTSLRAWRAAAPAAVTKWHVRLHREPTNQAAWQLIHVLSQYHHARIILWRSDFLHGVLRSPQLALTSKAATQAIDAANSIADVIAKPLVEYSAGHRFSPHYISTLYSAVVILIVALKLPSPPADTARNAASLDVLFSAIRMCAAVWPTARVEQDFLDRLARMEDLATILDALNPALLPTISDDKPTIFDTICGWRLPDDGLCAFGMPGSSPTSTPSSKSNAAASTSSVATNPPVREPAKRAPSSDASALGSQTPWVQPTGPPSVTSSNIQDAPWAATLEAQLGGGDLGLELLNSLVPPGIGDGSASAGASAATSHTSVWAAAAQAAAHCSAQLGPQLGLAVESAAPQMDLGQGQRAIADGMDAEVAPHLHIPLATSLANSPRSQAVAELMERTPAVSLSSAAAPTPSLGGAAHDRRGHPWQHAAAEPRCGPIVAGGGPLLPGGRPGGVPGAMFSG